MTSPAAACLLLAASAPADAQDRARELDALRRAIEESRDRVAAYESEERGLLEALEAADRTLALLGREVASAGKDAERARAELAVVEREREGLEAALGRTTHAMRARAVALYKAGEAGGVRLLFSSDGIREFLTRVSALRLLLRYDADLIGRHRAQVAALEEAAARTREAAAVRDRALAELEERRRQLGAERATKQRLAARIRADRRHEREALEELERAARALEETLAALGREPRTVPVPAPGAHFASLRQRLPAPVAGATLAQRFGLVVDPEFLTRTFRKGLVLRAPLGAPVRAVAPGVVRFAGWFRGYGQIVILDHGDGYFTVSGHLGEIAVEVGEAVAAGDAVGAVGDTGSLTGPRLYFEIRKGAEPLDPTEWVGEWGSGWDRASG